MFSRPANNCKHNGTVEEAPKFARPRFQLKERRNELESNGKQTYALLLIVISRNWEVRPLWNVETFPFVFANAGSEWSPKMDVAESGSMYVVSIELPGVNINDIKVEVSHKR